MLSANPGVSKNIAQDSVFYFNLAEISIMCCDFFSSYEIDNETTRVASPRSHTLVRRAENQRMVLREGDSVARAGEDAAKHQST